MKAIELVQKLKKGQRAIANSDGMEVVIENQMGTFMIVQVDGSNTHRNVGNAIAFTSTILELDWKIEAMQVGFMDAYQHLCNGGKVKSVFIDRHGEQEHEIYSDEWDAIYFEEVVNGKWFIIYE